MRFKFLHGLDDDMREQALKDFWHENKLFIIGGFAMLFLSYGAGQGYIFYKAHKLETQAQAYYEAMQEGTPQAYKEFSQKTTTGFQGLALFKAAQQMIDQDKPEEAVSQFESIRQTSGMPRLWRDLAAIRQAELLLARNPQKAQNILAKLVSDNSPYLSTAFNLLAIEAQNRQAFDEAVAYYERLSSMNDLPNNMRENIQQRLSYLQGKGLLKSGISPDNGGTN